MLTIRDLRKTMGGRTLFENAAMTVNYGERVALVGPNGAGKSTLFSIILKKDTAGCRSRGARRVDDGRLPAAGKRGGRRRDGAGCGDRAAPAKSPRWRSDCTSSRRRATVSGPEYLEAHAKHEALSDPQVEAKAKKMLRGLGYRETGLRAPGEGDERRLGHARAPGAVARDGARSAPAR